MPTVTLGRTRGTTSPRAPCPTCHNLLRKETQSRRSHPPNQNQSQNPGITVSTPPRLEASLPSITNSMLDGCFSCRALFLAISPYGSVFKSYNIPLQNDDRAMDGYNVSARIGYSVQTPIPGVEEKRYEMQDQDIFVNGAVTQGCGLCLKVLWHNGVEDWLGTLVELDIFCEEEFNEQTHSLQAPVSTSIAGNTASSASLAHALRRIANCERDHDSCKSVGNTLPDRVLDLDMLGSSDIVLVETKNEEEEYVTLSHCWGKIQQFTTTRDTLDARKTCIAWTDLPKTFQEAVTFTRRLGLRYLWIDSLCIIQQDVEDWEKQGAKMASIYEHSYITLAATSGRSSHDGCFFTASPEYRAREIKLPDESGVEHRMFVRRHLPHWLLPNPAHSLKSYAQHFPLLERAWVYQERLLSRRVIHFGPHELIFECNTSSACECSFMNNAPANLQLKPRHASILSLEPPSGFAINDVDMRAYQWRKLVEEYSALNLTYESDRLPAIAGLASQRDRLQHDGYFAGLWQASTTHDLLWQVRGTPAPKPTQKSPIASWSWASVGRPISFEAGMHSRQDSDAVFISAFGAYADGTIQSSYNPETPKKLEITSHVLAAYLVVYSPPTGPNARAHHPELITNCRAYWFCPDYALEPTTGLTGRQSLAVPQGGRYVTLLRIARDAERDYSLVLDIVEGSGAEMLVHERIGLLIEDDGPPSPQRLPWEKGIVRKVCVR